MQHDDGHAPSRHIALPLDPSGDALIGLRSRLMDAANGPAGGVIQVDGQDVEQLGTAALGVLVAANRVARSRGTTLEIIHPNWLLMRRLEETGLNRVLRVVVDAFPPRPWAELG